MRVAYVTSGEVGGGHLSRGLAIARALDRAGARVDYRVFARPLPFPAVRDPRVAFVEMPPEELGDPARAPGSALARALASFAPDLVVVDLFWATLRYVLPLAGAEAWLLLRWHPPPWVGGAARRGFDPSRYARVLAIEPIASAAERLEPIVAANPDELLPAAALAERLGIAPPGRVHLVVQTGARGEIDALVARARASAAEGDALVPLSLWNDDAIFPLAPWLGGAHRIVGGAGYNLYWESRWLGLDARAELVPFPRTIDDQALRVRACAGHVPRANGADELVRAMVGR